MRLHCIAMVFTVGLTTSAIAADRTFSHREWWATCDDQRSCTVFGGLDAQGERMGFVRITRDAAPAALPEMQVVVVDGDRVPPAGTPVTLAIDGPTGLRRTLPLAAEAEPTDYATSVRLSGREALELIPALIQGQTLTLGTPGKPVLTVPLAGSAAVLRWIDDRQRRAGGVTALVARGPAPAQAMPPVPELPQVRRATLPPQDNLPATVPAAVTDTAAARACAEEFVPGPESESPSVVARLAPDLLLVSMPCGAGAYNFTSLFLLVTQTGVRGAGLTSEQTGDDPDRLVNADFDPATAELHSFAKGRGIGDCGVAETHVWDGAAFRLTERREMGECAGVPPSLWPVTYRALVK